jgi:hypothetical protein
MKYILGRAIRFHDLAFFDPVIYESLRQLVVDAETKDSNSLFSALDLTFRYGFSDVAVFVLHIHTVPGLLDIHTFTVILSLRHFWKSR